jgi:aspartyl-tRNA(Asn)/glutamyl-tRNA(Gln) amidotransferase subunit B
MKALRGWEAVIGLEIHVQLKTRSKLFCPCPNRFGGEANTRVCPVCLGHPGTLPVLNERAVALAVRLALALDCSLAERSIFARKNYVYPDLPKGYQISQSQRPICRGGRVSFVLDGSPRSVDLERIHLEEDAGKNLHGDDGWSRVDYNRAGTPLVEIVTGPDLRSPEEAMAFLRSLRMLVRYLEVSDGNMEEGSLRCDANVSVRRIGAAELGTKVEIKNLNSVRFVGHALHHEIERQVDLLERRRGVVQETRGWDEGARVSRAQRSKEGASDYRYFPEPDLPPLVLSPATVEEQRAALPELPHQKVERYRSQWRLSEYDARVLSASRGLAEWFEAAVAAAGPERAKGVANWTQVELLGRANEDGIPLHEGRVEPAALARVLQLIDAGTLSTKMAKRVVNEMWSGGEAPDAVVERLGLVQLSDPSRIDALVDALLDRSPEEVGQYLAGKTKLLGWFVGQLMRETRGQANPQVLNESLRAALEARR